MHIHEHMSTWHHEWCSGCSRGAARLLTWGEIVGMLHLPRATRPSLAVLVFHGLEAVAEKDGSRPRPSPRRIAAHEMFHWNNETVGGVNQCNPLRKTLMDGID